MAASASNLSPEQRIGQLFMVGFPGTVVDDAVRELIVKRYVGGVILFTRNIRDAAQTAELTATLQALARAAGHPCPLLIAADQENGIVRRLGRDTTCLPGNMALGAAGSEALAREVASATGRELLAHGVNMNLAPTVDVNMTPANPVIGVRSFGDDPRAVGRLGAAAVAGYADAGVIPTLKHFPGHGDTTMDSHMGLPVLPHTLDRLDAVELPPFREGIAAGAECVMLAHVALPALTGGIPVAAPLAPEIVQGLLRDRLGYVGVAITDCLEMRAIRETVGIERAAVRALAAGMDLVLISHVAYRQRAAHDAVRAALRSGALTEQRILEAAERVLRLKRHLRWDGPDHTQAARVVGCAAHRTLSETAYARTTTVIRDTEGRLPLRLAPEARVMVLAPAAVSHAQVVELTFSGDAFIQRACHYHPRVEGITLGAEPGNSQLRAAVDGADVLVVLTMNAHLDARMRELVRWLAQLGKPTIGIATSSPYDAAALPEVGTYLATYEHTEGALAAVADVVFGGATATGRLPLTLGE